MRERVIPDLMSLRDDSPDESRVFVRVLADDKEDRLNPALFQNVQDLRRPIGIGTVIKAKNDLARVFTPFMIDSRIFRKLRVSAANKALWRGGKGSRPVFPRSVHSYNFTIPD